MSIHVPDLHVSNKTSVKGKAIVKIDRRADPAHSGEVVLKVSVSFDPTADEYPTGNVTLETHLTDSTSGTFESTSVEQVTAFGKHTPTAVITGRCKAVVSQGEDAPKGCRFWILFANNTPEPGKGTPDVVSFLVYDRAGNRVAYGTGPVAKGDVTVQSGE